MIDKYIYENIPSLLKNECPTIYENYLKSIVNNNCNPLIAIKDSITSNKIYFSDTEMYKISKILRNLQFTTKYNIVRIWNDSIVSNCSEESGKLLVSNIIYPNAIEK